MVDNNICNSTAYLNAVYQKQKRLLFNFPLTRLDNLASSPYPQYNQFDLDMRRKAEILSYKSNRMSTQTNSLTRAQRYKQLVQGSSQRRTLSNSFILENTRPDGTLTVCPDKIIKTTTSAADVPGPIMDLYLDPDIPLYNLNKNTNDYGLIMDQDNQTLWTITDISNIDCLNTTTYINPLYANLLSVYMLNVQNPIYNFTVSFPFNIYIEAQSRPDAPVEIYNESNTVSVFDVTFGVFYSTNQVQLSGSPTTTTQMDSFSIIPQNINSTQGYFANVYAGVITLSNIDLQVEKGFIYDFNVQMSFSFTQSANYDKYFYSPEIKGVLNTTRNIQTQNCHVVSSITVPDVFPKLIFSGVGV